MAETCMNCGSKNDDPENEMCLSCQSNTDADRKKNISFGERSPFLPLRGKDGLG